METDAAAELQAYRSEAKGLEEALREDPGNADLIELLAQIKEVIAMSEGT